MSAVVFSIFVSLKTTNPLNGSHGHWSRLAKVRKEQRAIAGMIVRCNTVPNAMDAYAVTLTRKAPSNGLDFDGLTAALKSVRDGTADGLGFKDDNDPRLHFEYAQERSKTYGVQIHIERRP